eukprot:UN01561
MDMTSALIDGKMKQSEVIQSAKAPLQKLEKEIDENIESQPDLLKRISDAFEKFQSKRNQSDSEKQREAFVNDINKAAEVHKSIFSNSADGLKFYSDLDKNFLQALKTTVDGFVFVRQTET